MMMGTDGSSIIIDGLLMMAHEWWFINDGLLLEMGNDGSLMMVYWWYIDGIFIGVLRIVANDG